MICPKVLILTLFISGTFAIGTLHQVEKDVETLEVELAEAKNEIEVTIGSSRGSLKNSCQVLGLMN